MSRILVTGGAGFIGSHVVDRLLLAGHTPRILDTRPSPHRDDVETVIGDVRRLDDVIAAARGCGAIMHLAAAADVGDVAKDPIAAEQLNSRGTVNVLDAARAEGIGRVVYASTIWVYSDVTKSCLEVDEDTLLPAPAHFYTATKLAGELYCRSYQELYGVDYTILRFGIPYGPRARPAAVIPIFVSKALAGEPLTLAGGGAQARRFVYVEDLAEGVVKALAPVAANRTYNLVGDEDVTILRLAEEVRDAIGDVEVVVTEGRSGDFRGAEVSGVRAAEELGWQAETSFSEGLRKYVAWHGAAAVAPTPTPALTPAIVPALRWRPREPGRLALLAFVGLLAGVLLAALTRTIEFRDPANVIGTLLLSAAPAALVARLNWTRNRRDGVLVIVALFMGALLGLDSDGPKNAVHLVRGHPWLVVTVLLVATLVYTGVRRRRAASVSG
jgi:UDP-glucose 4-epimerase